MVSTGNFVGDKPIAVGTTDKNILNSVAISGNSANSNVNQTPTKNQTSMILADATSAGGQSHLSHRFGARPVPATKRTLDLIKVSARSYILNREL